MSVTKKLISAPLTSIEMVSMLKQMKLHNNNNNNSTHLHRNGLHVVADEVAQLLVAAIAAILLAVAHLRVVDDCLIVYYRYLACC